MKILIVDDDPDIRELLRLWLERDGFEVLEAGNGMEAEQVQLKYAAEVLICDLIMPEKEGIETISLFRQRFPEIGIIAISGGGKMGPASYLDAAKHLGAWKVFSKPLDVSQLVESLHEWQLLKNKP